MSDDPHKPIQFDQDAYEDYARKMDQFAYGPTTTYFEQLISKGIDLPAPDALSDADIGKRLWEVTAGLASLRVYLEGTDHLSDRDLYATLWSHHLRGETPAIDEIGFTTRMDIVSCEDEDEGHLFLKHYADVE